MNLTDRLAALGIESAAVERYDAYQHSLATGQNPIALADAALDSLVTALEKLHREWRFQLDYSTSERERMAKQRAAAAEARVEMLEEDIHLRDSGAWKQRAESAEAEVERARLRAEVSERAWLEWYVSPTTSRTAAETMVAPFLARAEKAEAEQERLANLLDDYERRAVEAEAEVEKWISEVNKWRENAEDWQAEVERLKLAQHPDDAAADAGPGGEPH